MFKPLSSALLLSLALFIAPVASAQTDPATAALLLRESGAWKQLEAIAPQMRGGVQQALSNGEHPVEPAVAERAVAALDGAFAVDRLRAVAQSVVAERTRKSHVPALLAWFRSPLGKRMTKLEEDGSADTREPSTAMQEDAALLASLPARRQALLAQLSKAARTGDTMATVTINTMVAVQQGLASAMPDSGAPLPSSELRKSLESKRPQLTSAMDRLAIASYARIYASVPEADLVKYGGFLKSAAGQHFMDVTAQAFDAALTDGGTEFGRSLPGASERESS